jgi:hypothetical protein
VKGCLLNPLSNPTPKHQIYLAPPIPHNLMHRNEFFICLLALPFPQLCLFSTHKAIVINFGCLCIIMSENPQFIAAIIQTIEDNRRATWNSSHSSMTLVGISQMMGARALKQNHHSVNYQRHLLENLTCLNLWTVKDERWGF